MYGYSNTNQRDVQRLDVEGSNLIVISTATLPQSLEPRLLVAPLEYFHYIVQI